MMIASSVALPDTTPLLRHLESLLLQGTRWAEEGDDPRTGASCFGFIRHAFQWADVALPATPEVAQSLFTIVPPPYQPWDVLLCNFHLMPAGPRHLALLLEPGRAWHCSRASNGLARVTVQSAVWQRVLVHGLRYQGWLCT